VALQETDGLSDTHPLRVTLDATPLLGSRTGIGRYVQALAHQLSAAPGLALAATAFTLRSGQRPADLPLAVGWHRRRVSARLLQASWRHTGFPPVEWLAGAADVFHATNFVLPPSRSARGVVTIHDLSFLRYPEVVSASSGRYRELVPLSIRRARVICTPSAAIAGEVAAEYRLPSERIVVTPLGVDESWFRAKPADASTRQRIGLPAQYLVAVGTLEPRKNLATLIAAYRRLIADGQPVRPLVLVGPAGWGEALELSGLPVGTVLSTGYLDQADLQSVVAGSAGLIFPSLYEGFGLPPLEALATGRPVIASDSSVSREVLGNQAVLVTAQDPDGLAIAISRLPSSESPSDAAVAARREWAARWTWDNCAAATRTAYELALRN